ncbi:hypothetical protein WJR50_17485 [Catalinimonas sp. 4WD22]|uniref:hypothetical protein n=1 Tax=Catalinimonas locisalis TaxID=3133978 RepID=UPI0031013E9C
MAAHVPRPLLSAGREKTHALGALDMALWDIKGKALDVPVHMLLGGKARAHIECYTTAYPGQTSLRDKARAAMDDGFRAYRCIVFHTRLDMNDAIRLSGLIEYLEPYFVEDLIRSENPSVYRLS